MVAVLGAVTCGGGGGNGGQPTQPTPPPNNPPPSGSTVVSIPQGAMSLNSSAFGGPLTVAVGATVTWENDDSLAHTSTSDTGVWNSGTLQPGRNFSFTFNTAGTFPYHCSIHPNMTGSVTAR